MCIYIYIYVYACVASEVVLIIEKLCSKISHTKWPPSNGFERFKCHFSRAFERFRTVQEASNYFELFRTISLLVIFYLRTVWNGSSAQC